MEMLGNFKKPLIILFLIIATAISTTIILSRSGEVPKYPWDQSFVEMADLGIRKEAGIWTFNYPQLQNAGGISGSLLVGLYKLIIPTSAKTLDYHIKILAMFLFFLSGFLMAKQYLRTDIGLFIFVLIMVTRGYQFMELSNEILAAVFFFLFLYGFAKAWHPVILNLLLVSFGVSKPELTVVAISLVSYWIWTESSSKKRKLISASFVMWLFLFLFPAFFLHGKDAILGGRALTAFGQHYGMLFNDHQLVPSLNPWGDWEQILHISFPAAESFFDVVALYTRKYLDYVALSVVSALLTMVNVFKGLPLAFACRKQFHGRSQAIRCLESLFFVSFVAGLLPLTLISSPHAGNFPKYLLPLAVLCVSYWEDCSLGYTNKTELGMKNLILTVFLLTIIWQLNKFLMRNYF